ncbi:hypothetical protein RI129_003039 [Pyrocoelia pectoralis]|uniref:DDE Tnp4 domain-containing protein n=1 Tax=Pyrocoelia pectoralis TaxID=417401 RepID=A0AAN7VHH2_9COLE
MYSDAQLLQRFRFSRYTIQNILLPMIFVNNDRRNNRGLPVPPIMQLCIALRFFASGAYQISRGSEQNQNEFYRIGRFPGVIGCIDGTHIPVKNPGGQNGEVYRNRKGWMSLNVQAVVAPDYKIYDIIIRWPGSAHDSRIFNNSTLKMKLDNGQLRGKILGDSAYAQSFYLFTPVPEPHTPSEERYNRAHILTRNVVERGFGIWKQRFRCLNKKMNHKIRNAQHIICATAILHNIAITQQERFVPDPNFVEVAIQQGQVAHQLRGNAIRAAFIERHFN